METGSAVTVYCANCGAPKLLYPSHVAERNFCNRACLGAYRSRTLTGAKASHWKGGSTVSHGRLLVHMPWHHRANAKGYVERAVIVAELKLRRDLFPEEIVHHDDLDAGNDHPDNIMVLANQAEHINLHRPQMLAARKAKKEKTHG